MRTFYNSLGYMFILIGACLVAAFIVTSVPENKPAPNVHTVYSSGGGEVFAFSRMYGEYADRYEFVRVNGMCGSACTFLFQYWEKDKICYTDNALFGFHAIQRTSPLTGTTVAEKETELVFSYLYPEWLQSILYDAGVNAENNWGLNGPFTMAWFTGEELGLTKCE